MSSDVGLTEINMPHAFISAYKSGGEDYLFIYLIFLEGGLRKGGEEEGSE